MSWHVRHAEQIKLAPPASDAAHCSGYLRDDLAGRHAGAVHTGYSICELTAGGHFAPHIHSTEESFFVLAGSPVLIVDGRAVRLGTNDCGLIPVGASHAWRAGTGARWVELHAPAPRLDGPPDTFFTGEAHPTVQGEALDLRDPRNRTFFRLDPTQLELDNLKAGSPVEAAPVSATVGSPLLVSPGVAVRMLIDQRLGAALHTMFVVDLDIGGAVAPHDHPLEESYFVLDGEVEVTTEDDTFTLFTGDFLWNGVGTIHSFANRSPRRVRWLETQSPQPPSRHSHRFSHDWEYLEARLDGA
jgi:mannose-6-phosphate isomerase-like protein (cupin superfamily)